MIITFVKKPPQPRFDGLFELLYERYRSYDVPKGDNASAKEKALYDFYVLRYAKDKMAEEENAKNKPTMDPTKFYRDVNSETAQALDDAFNKLIPFLKEDLLRAVFYALCCEFRHTFARQSTLDKHTDADALKLPTRLYNILSTFERTYLDYTDLMPAELLDTLDGDTRNKGDRALFPTLQRSVEEDDDDFDETVYGRVASFSAAQKTIEKEDITQSVFVRMMEMVFRNASWTSGYGGPAWANICAGWTRLMNSVTKEDTSVAIDHVYDLQHNTDTVFNKLIEYYKTKSEYSWIKEALDKKAKSMTTHDLLDHCSGTVRSIVLPILYNRTGKSLEGFRKDQEDEKKSLNFFIEKQGGADTLWKVMDSLIPEIEIPSDFSPNKREKVRNYENVYRREKNKHIFQITIYSSDVFVFDVVFQETPTKDWRFYPFYKYNGSNARLTQIDFTKEEFFSFIGYKTEKPPQPHLLKRVVAAMTRAASFVIENQ